MNENTLNKTHLRSIQYWFEDGIVELGVGGLFLLLGIYFYLQATLEIKFLAELLSGAFALVFIGGWYLVGRFIRSAKEHITFPRTGYVAYKRDEKAKKPLRLALAMIVGALVSGGVIVLITRHPLGMDFMPTITGLAIAIVLGLIGFRTHLPRFYLPAVFGLLCGIGLTVNSIGNILGIALLYLATAIVLLISGVVVFRHYLKTNPAPTDDSHDK
jgi:hypothetical protein